MVDSTRPDVVCLQETKKATILSWIVMSTLGADFDEFTFLPATGTRGGILLAWKGCICKALAMRVDVHSVSVQFDQLEGSPWWFTGVYGPQSDELKIQFLQELRNIRMACAGPWAVGGDFNLIYMAHDKRNVNMDRAMMGRFRRLLNDVELSEVDLMDRRFTWSNEREAPTLVWLDWVFVSTDWDQLFPDYVLQSSALDVSDHCPLLLGLQEFTMGKRRFHFKSFWSKFGGFLEEVKSSWDQPSEAACPLQRLAYKYKRLARDLQSWSQRKTGHIKRQLQTAREIVHQLEIAQDSRLLSSQEGWPRRQLKQHILGLASLERTIARTRSRLNWLKEGDTNTAYFQHHARYRKKKNFMAKLKVADRVLTDQEEKKQAVWDFYNNLLGMSGQREFTLDLQAFHRPAIDLSDLEQVVTEEEVWATIKSLPSDKAPGPDGYTGRFYKLVWEVIKSDLMAAVSRLMQGDVSDFSSST
jgi:exonuclease III